MQEFKKISQLHGTAISSASASVQSELVDLLVEKLDESGWYLSDVGSNVEILSSVGSGAYPIKDKSKRKGGSRETPGSTNNVTVEEERNAGGALVTQQILDMLTKMQEIQAVVSQRLDKLEKGSKGEASSDEEEYRLVFPARSLAEALR